MLYIFSFILKDQICTAFDQTLTGKHDNFDFQDIPVNLQYLVETPVQHLLDLFQGRRQCQFVRSDVGRNRHRYYGKIYQGQVGVAAAVIVSVLKRSSTSETNRAPRGAVIVPLIIRI